MIKQVNENMYCGKFITFEKTQYPVTHKGNPYFWEVTNTKDGSRLGYIEWFNKWKKFCFFNYDAPCVFEEVCLGDIAEFLVARTKGKKLQDAATSIGNSSNKAEKVAEIIWQETVGKNV
jgi:hypothetical protein